MTSAHDDDNGLWQAYNHLEGPKPMWQMLASSWMFIAFVNSGLTGVLAALAAVALDAPGPLVGTAAAAGGLSFLGASAAQGIRRYQRIRRRYVALFPAPDTAGTGTVDGNAESLSGQTEKDPRYAWLLPLAGSEDRTGHPPRAAAAGVSCYRRAARCFPLGALRCRQANVSSHLTILAQGKAAEGRSRRDHPGMLAPGPSHAERRQVSGRGGRQRGHVAALPVSEVSRNSWLLPR